MRRCLPDGGDHLAAPGSPKTLYDDIVSAATSHETAYVTCTRALKRMPRENEVVVACVGDITAETWFSVLADYPNVSVYLPLGVCDKCRNTGGEDILGEAIATAEEWAGTGMGLEVDPKSLKCHKRREYERKEYMDKIARTTGLTVTKLNPATAALASVTQKLKAHRHQITQLERTLNTMCGTTTPSVAVCSRTVASWCSRHCKTTPSLPRTCR